MLPLDLDPYAILEVHPAVEHDVLKAAYRTLARRFHPDISPSTYARRRMVEINRAWELVSDPTRRAELDRTMRVARDVADASRVAAGGDGVPVTGTSQTRSEVPGFKAGQQPQQGWGAGAKGLPPGRPSGSIVEYGIYLGWSLGEILRVDPPNLDWLTDRPEGKPYRDEIESLRGRGGAGRTAGGPRRFGS